MIAGALNANGKVFVLNSSGVLFTQGAQVNVGGIVASTLNMSDADFMAGKAMFTANGSRASVINLGTINVADGGYSALLGNQVKNDGVIVAKLGAAVLAGGDKISLNFNGDSLVGVTIDQGALNALVENGNAIRADGGLVVLTAKGLDTVLATVVNNTGEIRAQTIEDRAGKIYLLGGLDNDRVEVGGTLDASAPKGGNGGFIETSAAKVKIVEDVQITTSAPNGRNGEWLIDPVDFTIAATGGDITGTQLGTLLDSSSVTVETAAGTNTATNLYGAAGTNGDIHVNDAISWSGANTLTLSAHRNINVNQNITGSNAAAGVIFLYGQGSSDGAEATFNQATSATITAASQQWRKGSDLDGIRYAVVNGDVFLGGKFIELGINKSGYFGANGKGENSDFFTDNSMLPSLFYGRQRSFEFGIGMTGAANAFANSYDKTTSTSTSSDLRIDYFLPGAPFENASFGWDGVTKAEVSYDPSTSPDTTTVRLLPLGAGNTLTATVTSTKGDLQITQVITLGKGEKYFNNAVTMTNTGASTLNDVVYLRNFDPDNTVDINNGSGVYDTIQKIDRSIAAGDKITIVSATSPLTDPWYTTVTPDPYYLRSGSQAVIFYSTSDERVQVGFDTNNWNSPQPFWGGDITPIRTQIGTLSKGSSTVGKADSFPDGSLDGAMGLLFSGGNVAAGRSVNFNYNTVLAMGTVETVLIDIPFLSTPGKSGATGVGPSDGVIEAARSSSALPRGLLVSRVTGRIDTSTRTGTFSNVATVPASIESSFGPGARLALISSPRGDEPTQVVSITEASSMLASRPSDDGGVDVDREVRVPASRNSLVDIVNGGVKLPEGVEQQLFVVKSN